MTTLNAVSHSHQAPRPNRHLQKASTPNPHTALPLNDPTAATEPRSFADALADIRFLQQRVATATRALLRKRGWRHTCLTPAHLWLWSKKLPGGRTILTDLNTALAVESSLAHQPPLPEA
jgi:hypothetical protein